MPSRLHPRWSALRTPVIAMVHLLPLPGSPRYGGSLSVVREAMLRDAEALSNAGVHGLMVENFGDVPFYPARVPAHTVAHMTALAGELRRRFDLPLGVNVLRNDGLSALAVAHAARADFIRVNVLCSARVADQGLLQAIAHDLLRERAALGAKDTIKILADVDVKHSAALAERPLADEVADTIERGLADAVIVSGSGTGRTTDLDELRAVKSAAGGAVPILVGSGVSAKNAPAYAAHADALIVGTAFKKDGSPMNPVEADRVKALLERLPQGE